MAAVSFKNWTFFNGDLGRLFDYFLYFIFRGIQISGHNFNAYNFQGQIVKPSQFPQKVVCAKNDCPDFLAISINFE